MNLKGIIKTSKRVIVKNQECYGVAVGHKNTFTIKIDESIFRERPTLFLKVLLHELIHLYFFIIEDYTKSHLNLTEGIQHKLMRKPVKDLTKALVARVLKVIK